jgi:hypothetical protein
MLFDFDDILITPTFLSNINSRKEVKPFHSDGFLPLMTAPMDTVISLDNKDIFEQNKVHVVLPRNVVCKDDVFISYGLDQFIDYFITTKRTSDKPFKVLIDIANGHMEKLINTSRLAKKLYGDNMILMVGNVANPSTFKKYCDIGVDYVRIGIGNGCFIDNTMVTTKNGQIPIQDIKDGDLVLTHNKQYKEVVGTKRFAYDGELIKINDGIICTPDHEFYVVNKKYSDIITEDNIHNYSEWVSAMELYNNSDYLLIELDDYEENTTI